MLHMLSSLVNLYNKKRLGAQTLLHGMWPRVVGKCMASGLLVFGFSSELYASFPSLRMEMVSI